MNKTIIFWFLMLFALGTLHLSGQVTVGEGKAPEGFSVLEVSATDTKGGLRLPHLTTAERDALRGTSGFTAEEAGKAMGLTIFNITNKCVETWNSTKWISMCDGVPAIPGTLTEFNCSSVTGTTSISIATLSNINLNTLTLPYTKTGGDVVLTNNAVLGATVNGLTAQVRGNQTLTAASGVFNIKVTGTPSAFGTFQIPVTAGGNTCYVQVIISQTGGAIGTLTCGTNSISVIKDVAVTSGNTFTISYSGKTGADISLTDGQVLGSANGLTVVAGGGQTLSAASGSVNIKITGTATSDFNLPYTVGGATCNISVTVSTCTSITAVTISGGKTITQGNTAPVVLTATVTGGPVTSYEWYKGGALVETTTVNTYTVPQSVKDVEANNAYTVKAINGCSDIISSATNVNVITNPGLLPLGNGTLGGRICFDIAVSNDGGDCGNLSSRLPQKADFSQSTTYNQTYTLNVIGGGSDLSFIVIDNEGCVLNYTTGGTTTGSFGPNAYTATLNIEFKHDLHLSTSIPKIVGRTRAQAAKVYLYAKFHNGSQYVTIPLTVSIQDCACCGAYVAPGVWKNFMCHNLGADDSLDPFTSVPGNADGTKGTYGWIFQWGRKADGHQYRNSPVSGDYSVVSTIEPNPNGGGRFIADGKNGLPWDWLAGTNNRPDRWTDSPKGVNDPCPTGWKVPSAAQWRGVIANNTITYPGGGALIGGTLFLPAVYMRNHTDGRSEFYDQATYWSSTAGGNSSRPENPAWRPTYEGSTALTLKNGWEDASTSQFRGVGLAVRCIQVD